MNDPDLNGSPGDRTGRTSRRPAVAAAVAIALTGATIGALASLSTGPGPDPAPADTGLVTATAPAPDSVTITLPPEANPDQDQADPDQPTGATATRPPAGTTPVAPVPEPGDPEQPVAAGECSTGAFAGPDQVGATNLPPQVRATLNTLYRAVMACDTTTLVDRAVHDDTALHEMDPAKAFALPDVDGAYLALATIAANTAYDRLESPEATLWVWPAATTSSPRSTGPSSSGPGC
jgi:type IV secretory pathway VirB10-like protein